VLELKHVASYNCREPNPYHEQQYETSHIAGADFDRAQFMASINEKLVQAHIK
jgi:hypothetical protein